MSRPEVRFMSYSYLLRKRFLNLLLYRFAELENLVFISILVMKYKVDIKPEPEFANESFKEKEARILKYYHGLTIT